MMKQYEILFHNVRYLDDHLKVNLLYNLRMYDVYETLKIISVGAGVWPRG